MGYNPSLGVFRKFSPPMMGRRSGRPRESFLSIRGHPPIRARDFAGTVVGEPRDVLRLGAAALHSAKVPRAPPRPPCGGRARPQRPEGSAEPQKTAAARILRGGFAGRTHHAVLSANSTAGHGGVFVSRCRGETIAPPRRNFPRAEVSPRPLAPSWQTQAGNTPYRAAAARRGVGSTTTHPTHP